MMRHELRSLFLAVIFAVASLAAATPAQARLVAILFDTSGSMRERYQLPSFGARLLAATIDGRAGFDRLLATNLDAYVGNFGINFPTTSTLQAFSGGLSGTLQIFDVTDDGSHQRMISELERTFQSSGVVTPYGPIEVMLDRIARDLEAASEPEEVIFVIVSDGKYHENDDFKNGRRIPQMQTAFKSYRDRIAAAGSSLQAEFLFIDATGNLRHEVEDQGVRDTLLGVFNGPQRGPDGELQGSRYVTSADKLWEALQDIIASTAGTDRQAQKSFVTYSGQAIEVKSPLSISRMVIVSTAEAGAPTPTLQSLNFGGVRPSDSRRLQVPMANADADFQHSPRRQGLVEHLWFQNPVPAGSYSLAFNAPVDEDVFLLFETSSLNDLAVFDENGSEIQPDADGVLTLYQNSTYQFHSRILDGLAPTGQPQVVPLATLPDLTMHLTLTGAIAPGPQSMTVDQAANLGRLTWTPTAQGELSAFSRASAGILSPSSPLLKLRVLDPAVRLELSPIRATAPCPTCAPDQVISPLEANSRAVKVGEFDVIADGVFDGAITFEPSALPPGFDIRDAAGNVIVPGEELSYQAGETRTFTLWRSGNLDADLLAAGAVVVELGVAPTGAWVGGSFSRTSAVLLTPPEMSITLENVTEPLTPGQIDGLWVPGGELLLGQFSAQFALTDILVAPDPKTIDERVSVKSNRYMDRLLSFELLVPPPATVGFNMLDVRPNSRFWCLCWIFAENVFLATPRREVTVNYSVAIGDIMLQNASVTVPMEFTVSRAQGGLSCAWNLLLLVLLYMFIRGVWALFTTHRFPKGARLEIVEPDERVSYKPLDRGNTVWLKAWLAAILGNPDEERVIEGLRLRATRNGAVLDISKGTPNWELERLGDSFLNLKKMQPKKINYKIIWDDKFESTSPPGRTLYLRKEKKSRKR